MSNLIAFSAAELPGLLEDNKGVLGSIAAIYAGAKIALSSLNAVEQGHLGVKTRFKKVRTDKQGRVVIKDAGPHLVFPGVHAYETISTRARARDLEVVEALMYGQDGVAQKWRIDASIVWNVRDAYRAIFEVQGEEDGLNAYVTNYCAGALFGAINNQDPGGIIAKQEEYFEGIRQSVTGNLGEVGVVLNELLIKGFAPSEAQVIADGIPGLTRGYSN